MTGSRSPALLSATSAMSAPIKVMLVDDSATVRARLRSTLERHSDIQVVAEAENPFAAREPFRATNPDVLVVDLVMPHMDGLAFLKKVMLFRPLPVVVFTSRATPEVIAAATTAGAVAVISKPGGSNEDAEHCFAEVVTAVRLHAHTLVRPPFACSQQVIAIGASTGGPDAIAKLIAAVPADLPPILIALHMPANFTGAFAQRLSHIGLVEAVEARDGMELHNGLVVIAPGDRHLLLSGQPGKWHAQLDDAPALRHHRPSVDRLFRSVAEQAGPRALGILLTGMGDDGADSLVLLRQSGGMTFAQDEQSSVVFGMPHEAIRRGGVERVLSLDEIPAHMIRWAHHAQERDSHAPAHL